MPAGACEGGGGCKARGARSTQVWGICVLSLGFALENGACEGVSVVSLSSAGHGLRGRILVSRLLMVGAVDSTCAACGFTVCIVMLFIGLI